MLSYVLPIEDDSLSPEGFSVVDVQLPFSDSNVAEIKLSERYPTEGFVLNRESEMIVRVIEGVVVFICNDEEVVLPAGSTALVPKDKPYCWVPRGTVTLYIVSTPPWTREQQESVEI